MDSALLLSSREGVPMLRGVVFILLVPLLLCSQNTKKDEIKSYEDGDAYNVYSAVLSLEKSDGPVLIGDSTVPFNDCLESRSDKLVDAAIENYKKINQGKWRLGHHFEIKQPYKLLSAKEADSLLQPDKRTGGWPLSPSNGIHRFSAVGYSVDKTIAFVEMDIVCGGLCGHGQRYILQKRDGRWKEYSGPESKIVKRKKLKDGTYAITMKREFIGYCSWNY